MNIWNYNKELQTINKIEAFSRRLALHSIAIPLDTFLSIYNNFESIITPMNIICPTFFKIMLFIMTDLCMFMLLFLLLKIRYFVLFTLRNNSFECSHSIILPSYVFVISIKVSTFFPVKNKFETSAYRMWITVVKHSLYHLCKGEIIMTPK